MKTYIKIIIGAILTGAILAFFFYRDINSEVVALTTKEYTVNLFQVGVFKDHDNALNYQKNFSPSIIYEDNNGYYRVIIGLAYHEENKVKLESFFTSIGINYYLKEIKMNEEFTDMLENYETILIKTDKEDVINNLNSAMLKLFITYLE